MPFMRQKKRQKADSLDYTQLNVIFHNANGTQTGDNMKLRNNGVYNSFGDTGVTSIENFTSDDQLDAPEYFDLLGRKVENPHKGLYLRRQGNRVTKVHLR